MQPKPTPGAVRAFPPRVWTSLLVAAVLVTACGYPLRLRTDGRHDEIAPLKDFEDVRAVDGYRSPAFQASFDEAIRAFHASPLPADGRRDFEMLVLSSGGVNGAFGAGILTAWTRRGDRPEFWTVSGVSVGALMAPFVFAGPEFDPALEELFRRLEPGDLHREKGTISSVLWDESLMDNSPLRKRIARGADMRLLHAVADRHEAGRRCYVGSTNLDIGHFVVWDLGAIASRRSEEALELFRDVLTASASIPVVYPPVRFDHEHLEKDELHVDGAVIRPLFIPQNVFDGYAAAERAGMNWDDVDARMWVVHNGSLRPSPVDVQRDTLAIAMRTVTMMSYTMVAEHVLHLYMLAKVWSAEFHFVTLDDGQELSVDSFSPDDTERLFLSGQTRIENRTAWLDAPPGYARRGDLERIQPTAEPSSTGDSVEARLIRIEAALLELQRQGRERGAEGAGGAPSSSDG